MKKFFRFFYDQMVGFGAATQWQHHAVVGGSTMLFGFLCL